MHFDLRNFFPNISNDVITDIVWQGCTKKVTSANDAWQQVATPQEICKRMIDKFSDLNGNILILFNVEFVKELLHRGVKQENVYIVIDSKAKERFVKNNFQSVKCKLLKKNDVKCLIETLKGLTMKFDKIIMNPPYNNSLHLKIVKETIVHLKDGGECVNLSPIRWLQDPLAKYKKGSDYKKYEDLRKSITELSIIPAKEVCEIFGISWGELGIYYFNKGNENSFDCDSLVNVKPSIAEKIALFKGDTLAKVMTRSPKGNFYIRVPTAYNPSGGNPRRQIMTTDISKALNNPSIKTNVCFFNFDSETEAKNFFAIFDLKFTRFLKGVLNSCYATPFNLMPWLNNVVNPRTKKKGYKSDWTNEDLYKFFNMTDDECGFIEEIMEKYK